MESRLLFIAKPDTATLSALQNSFDAAGLRGQLGSDLFPVANWHQSLSDRFNDTAENLRLLTEAGSAVSAAPFVLGFNRFNCAGISPKIHWALKTSKTPEAFKALLTAIKNALAHKRIEDTTGHTAHITVSYWAKTGPDNMHVAPVLWTIDEFMLVRGGGEPYHYDVLRRWKLAGEHVPASGQGDFFGGL
jgi:2'-5' RNA ligase